MSIWQDSNGGLHDDMNGAALALPSWPQDMTQLTDAQAAAIQDPPLTLAQAQGAQLALMDSAYATAVAAPIGYLGTTFQADQASQVLIAGVLTACGGALPSGFTWYDINNVAVPVTFAQLQGFAAAILLRGQPLFVHCQSLKATIRAATTVAAVQAVVW